MFSRVILPLFSSLFDFFSASLCLGCNQESISLICYPCKNSISKFPNSSEKIKYYGYYEGMLREIIHKFKFENRMKLASFFSELLVEIAPEKCDVVIPVPIFKQKLKIKKFNPAALVAQEFARALNKPCLLSTLIKTKNTPSQTDLPRSKRLLNIKNVFAITDVAGLLSKHIVLIDDVYTTGATLNECLRTFKQNGIDHVVCLTVARNL